MFHQVYINYSSPEEQVIALRLQSLGTACGISVIVPAVFSRQPAYAGIATDFSAQVDFAQLVFGIALSDISRGFLRDMDRARQLFRPTAIFASPTTSEALRRSYPAMHVAVIDPADALSTSLQVNNVLNFLATNPGERSFLLGFTLLAAGLIVMNHNTPRLPL